MDIEDAHKLKILSYEERCWSLYEFLRISSQAQAIRGLVR
jgi:hypothetical protein